MLFYQRVKQEPRTKYSPPVQGPVDACTASQFIPRALYESVWRENMQFLRDRNVFDPSYFEFVWQIVQQPPANLGQFQGIAIELIHCSSSNRLPESQAWNAVFICYNGARKRQERFFILCRSAVPALQIIPFRKWLRFQRGADDAKVCSWFLQRLSQGESLPFLTNILLKCPISEVRLGCVALVKTCFDVLAETREDVSAAQEIHPAVASFIGKCLEMVSIHSFTPEANVSRCLR